MKLVSWNVNGIRSVFEKGFETWFQAVKADVVCLQEIKAKPEQLDSRFIHPETFHSFWHPAEKSGYSGLVIYSKKEPLNVIPGLGKSEFDREGRVLTAEYSDFFVVNAYFPNSQRDHARLGYKLKFCDEMLFFLNDLTRKKPVLLCGDFNIAHREIDLKNPKENKDNAGFLPQERAWMDKILSQGYVDAFRKFNTQPEHYTWWSYRPTIRERNIGWRLDYWVTNQEFSSRLKKVTHQTQVMGSDHCPVTLELKP
ncbi:MAG: exodeoxyribonuclease III [Proteobacteria bacterium]|nr:exodeoxyribonuclease III [Pseudomonadota bacterium]